MASGPSWKLGQRINTRNLDVSAMVFFKLILNRQLCRKKICLCVLERRVGTLQYAWKKSTIQYLSKSTILCQSRFISAIFCVKFEYCMQLSLKLIWMHLEHAVDCCAVMRLAYCSIAVQYSLCPSLCHCPADGP